MDYSWLYREPPPEYFPQIDKFAYGGHIWHGHDKLLEFPSHCEKTGAPHLVAIDHTVEGFGMTKLSAEDCGDFPKEILDIISSIVPQSDRIHVIGNALGATETWGSNRNQDSFPRMGLMNSDPKTYGHKTFEDACVFKHHINKDPNKGIGKVTHAFFDSVMDKVLLLYYVLKDKAPHIVDRLEKGDSLDTSMGCRCPYDVCSICGNKAKTKATYCEHLRDHPNAIFPDGKKVMAHTPHPHFFDQSHVAKGADPIAKTLTVVDVKAKEAWDRRPKHFVMPGITHEMEKAAQFTKLAYPQLSKANVSYRKVGMGEPDSRLCKKCSHYDGGFCNVLEDEVSPRGTCRRFKSGGKFASDDSHEGKEAALSIHASIIKRIPGMAMSAAKFLKKTLTKALKKPESQEEKKEASFATELLPILEIYEENISPDLLTKLAESYDLPEILSSFASKGIVLNKEEFGSLLTKESYELNDATIDSRFVRQGILSKIGQYTCIARSCLPEYLYQRSVALVGSLEKTGAAQAPQISPEQMQMFMQMMAQQSPGVPEGMPDVHAKSVPKAGQYHLPQGVQEAVTRDALMNMYRTNLGRIDPGAFDKKPTSSAFQGDDPQVARQMPLGLMPKAGMLFEEDTSSQFIDDCRGVPVRAYLKYAHIDRGPGDLLSDWSRVEIPASNVWYQECVVKPREDIEKVASVLETGFGDLLDAATTLNLRFVREVLVGDPHES